MTPKRMLSLFDYSGAWSDPFLQAGWDVIHWDIKIDEFLDINSIDCVETALELFEDIDAVLAAVPCTDFAVSGAQYWKQKDSDGRTENSIQLVRQVLRIVDLFTPTDMDYDGTFFWCMENPVGRIPKLFPGLDKPYYFNPCDFAGWNDWSADDIIRLHNIRLKKTEELTRDDIQFVINKEVYTKKTGLWGDFNREGLDRLKNRIEPVKVCAQGSPIQVFGGKSAKTKEERSFTPQGFARAFYEANKNYKGEWN